MNLVIVKHENCGQKYLFKVPDKESVYAGDLVLVSNRRGQTRATCLCNSFSMEEGSDEYKAILTAFGATEPLASVVGRYFYSQFKATEDVAMQPKMFCNLRLEKNKNIFEKPLDK